jgi:hypothetical protein
MAEKYLGELAVKISGNTEGLAKAIDFAKKSTQDAKTTAAKAEAAALAASKKIAAELAATAAKAKQHVEEMGKKITKFGKDMSMKVTLPILGIGAAFLKIAADSDKAFAGKLKGIQDDFKALALSFTKSLMPAIEDGIKAIRGAIQWFTSLDDGTKKTIVQVALLAASIGPLATIIGGLIPIVSTLITVLSANPIILAAAAIIGVVIAMNKLTEATYESKTTIAGFAKENQKASMEMAAGLAKFDSRLADSFVKTFKTISDNFQGVVESYDNFGKRMQAQTASQMAKTTGLTQELSDKLYAELTQSRLTSSEKEIADITAKYEAFKKIYGIGNAEIVRIEKEKQEKIQEVNDKEKQAELDRIQSKLNDLKSTDDAEREKLKVKLDALNALQDAENKYRTEKEEEERALNERINAFQKSMIDSSISAFLGLTNARLAQIESQRDAEGNLSEELKNEKRNLLNLNKTIAIADIGIKTAMAIMTAFAQLGAFGLPASIFLAGVGAAQVAAVLATPIPALADGGLIMPQPGGTLVQAAEAGAPEFFVPETTDVMSRLADRISANMGRPNVSTTTNNNSQMPGNLNIDGKAFRVWITEEMDNGRIRVPKRSVR